MQRWRSAGQRYFDEDDEEKTKGETVDGKRAIGVGEIDAKMMLYFLS